MHQTINHNIDLSSNIFPIKILFLITDCKVGGTQRALFTIAQNLDQTIFIPEIAFLFCKKNFMLSSLESSNINYINFEMNSKFQIVALLRLFTFIKRTNPTILHAFLFHANISARIFGKIASVPIIISSRRSINLGGKTRVLINRLTNSFDDAIIAVSENVKKKELKETHINSRKIIVLNNCVDAEKFRPPTIHERIDAKNFFHISTNSFIIGSVGRLHPDKNFTILLQVINKIQYINPNLNVIIAGTGEQLNELEKQSAKLGLSNIVKLIGVQKEISKLLWVYDIFVLTSLVEGSPNALLETMSSGLPVIATDVGGVPEIIKNNQNGILIPKQDENALVEKIIQLMNNPELRTRLGKNAREFVLENHSIDNTVKNLENIYFQLLKQKGLI